MFWGDVIMDSWHFSSLQWGNMRGTVSLFCEEKSCRCMSPSISCSDRLLTCFEWNGHLIYLTWQNACGYLKCYNFVCGVVAPLKQPYICPVCGMVAGLFHTRSHGRIWSSGPACKKMKITQLIKHTKELKACQTSYGTLILSNLCGIIAIRMQAVLSKMKSVLSEGKYAFN